MKKLLVWTIVILVMVLVYVGGLEISKTVGKEFFDVFMLEFIFMVLSAGFITVGIFGSIYLIKQFFSVYKEYSRVDVILEKVTTVALKYTSVSTMGVLMCSLFLMILI